MPLKIYTISTPYDNVYQSLVQGVLSGSQWLRAPIVVPYSPTPTPFLIDATPGDIITIFINNKPITTITATLSTQQISLQLDQGYNYIYIKSQTENYLILVAATYWAIYLYAWAKEYYYNAGVVLEDAQRQLTDFMSLRSVEHQINFQELLPPTRAERILTGKLAVKGLINETGTTRGVNEIATAAINTTPIVEKTQVNTSFLDPAYDLYNTAQDFGGYEFNGWIPNLCTTVWSTFLTLVNNLPNVEILSASDIQILLNVGKTTAQIQSSAFISPTLFVGGETLDVIIDDVAFTVLFQAGDQTPETVAERINSYAKLAGLQYKVSWSIGNEIVISSGKNGIVGNVEVVGGTGYTKIGLPLISVIGAEGREELHTFNSESTTCNIIDTIFNSCFSKIRLWTSVDSVSNLAFCLWQYPLEILVELPLGSGLLDLGDTFDGGTFDSGDPADPYGDGFLGTILTPELDSGLLFDSFFDVTLPEDLSCAFTGPNVTSLGSSLVTTQLDWGTIPIYAAMKVESAESSALSFLSQATYSYVGTSYVCYDQLPLRSQTTSDLLTPILIYNYVQVEKANTTLHGYANDLQNFLTTKTNVTVLDDAIYSPIEPYSGFSYSDKLEETAVFGLHEGHRSMNFSTGLRYVFSCFAKAEERDVFTLTVSGGAFLAPGYGVSFDLTTATYSTPAGYNTPDWVIMIPMAKDYYYCAFAATSNATASSDVYLYLGYPVSYMGNAGDGLYLWGINVVSNIYYNSYVYTSSTPGTRSKNAMYYKSTSADWLRESFTVNIIPFYSSIDLALDGGNKYIAEFVGSTESYRIFIDSSGRINITGSVTGLKLQTAAHTWDFRQTLKIHIDTNYYGVSRVITTGFTTGDNTYTGVSYTVPVGYAVWWGANSSKNYQIDGFISEARQSL